MKSLLKIPAKIVLHSLFVRLWILSMGPPAHAQVPPQQPAQFIEETEDDGAAAAGAESRGEDGPQDAGPNGWNALFGILEAQATNGILHAGIRIAGTEFAGVTLSSIRRNLTGNWSILDQSLYRTNMLGHPYQGVFYFQGARANNWGFYASAANAVLGSLVWEIFCERARPSLNDLIVTPLAGAVWGESLHRLYYSAESLPAALRFIISPFDFINRYLPGGNPPARPNGKLWQLDASAGLFFGAQSRVNPSGSGFGNALAPGGYAGLNAVYGDPFETYVPWSDPFRAFELQIAADASYPVYQVSVFAGGMLYALDYKTAKTKGLAGLSFHFDTLWGSNVSFGGILLDFALTNRRALRLGNIDFKLHAGALLFGSANAFDAKPDLSGWSDGEIQVYGSGANLKLSIGINDTPAGDFAFSSALYFMPLYYDKDGYAEWGEMVFFWNPALSWIFAVTEHFTLSLSISDAFCVELFNEKQDIIEFTSVIRIAAGYRMKG